MELSSFIRSETWPYTSKVKAAEACPRLLCTVLTSSTFCKEKQRLEVLEEKLEAKTKVRKELAADYMEIDSMGQSTLLGKVQFSSEEADRLKGLAKEALLLRAVSTPDGKKSKTPARK